jgi:SAM-dependent methyltransferase
MASPSPFDAPHYEAITQARMAHLEELRLPLAGRSVLDVGSGIGRLLDPFVSADCDVTCIDGRESNIEVLRREYPGRRAFTVDVETDALLELGQFDIVFCYGLLYHLADPMHFIKRAAGICRELLLIETCIADAGEPLVKLVRDSIDETQSLHGFGCRPSPNYVKLSLMLAGFEYVYVPLVPPDHPEFLFQHLGDGQYLRDGRSMRQIFVSSRTPLEAATLFRM